MDAAGRGSECGGNRAGEGGDDLAAEERLRVREEQSAPFPAALEAWLPEQRARLSNSSSVAKSIDYMLRRFDRFTRFIEDGRVCLTNNAAERALRRLTTLLAHASVLVRTLTGLSHSCRTTGGQPCRPPLGTGTFASE